ncbi:hypothetical protein ACROYT_G041573 [Oculina patagonica]
MAALPNTKTLPCREEELRKIVSQYRTPFYLYDKEKMVNGAKFFYECFAWVQSLTGTSFKNHFAVKSTPTPMILEMLHGECYMGMDCSSLGELMLCEKLGIKGEDVMFTSNNTPLAEYRKAFEMGPDHNIKYNEIIGNPVEAKFGLTKAQLFAAYKKCKEYGVKRFGLYTMMVANSLNILDLAETARMMFTLAVNIKNETGISVEFVNMGGGIGVNYHPDHKPIDLQDLGSEMLV